MEETKPRFRSTIWNIRKNKTFNQNSKKKKEFFKKTRIIKEPLGHLQIYEHPNHRGTRRRGTARN